MNFWRKLFIKSPKTSGNLIVKENPFTYDFRLSNEFIRYHCPLCQSLNIVSLDQVHEFVGVQVLCSSCNIASHVPGIVKWDSKAKGIKITAGVKVRISEFSDWYFAHPINQSLLRSKKLLDHCQYGLWAYCANCQHQYKNTVLSEFSFANPNTIFTAHSTSSARDWEGLMDGRCPECSHSDLIVIVTDIPEYIIKDLNKRRKQASSD